MPIGWIFMEGFFASIKQQQKLVQCKENWDLFRSLKIRVLSKRQAIAKWQDRLIKVCPSHLLYLQKVWIKYLVKFPASPEKLMRTSDGEGESVHWKWHTWVYDSTFFFPFSCFLYWLCHNAQTIHTADKWTSDQMAKMQRELHILGMQLKKTAHCRWKNLMNNSNLKGPMQSNT